MNRFLLDRLSKNMQSHFHPIDPSRLQVIETISEDREMTVNVSDIIDINEENIYFLYGREDNEKQKNEESFPDLAKLKNSSFKKKRADLCILEVNRSEKALMAHIIEMKVTLDIDNYKRARSQLLNSLIDVELIALIALNSSFEIEAQFYLIYERMQERSFMRYRKVSKSSMTTKLNRHHAKVEDINLLAFKEYNLQKIISDMDIDNHNDRDFYRELQNITCKTVDLKKILA